MQLIDKDAFDTRCNDCKFYDATVEYGCKYAIIFLDVEYFCLIGTVQKEVQE